MSEEQQYKREPNGNRFQMSGMSVVLPIDMMAGKYPYLQNVRSYLGGRMTARATQAAAVQTLGAAVHSLRRLNDTTPLGPPSGFALIGGAGDTLYCNSTALATGLSSNPFSQVPFRPNSSPEPWMYIADSSQSTHIINPAFNAAGMLKVRADGLTYKMGVEEPQEAPDVATETTTVTGAVSVLGTARPWSNVAGANPTFGYGDNGNGTGPTVIATPITGASLTLTATGTATVNGSPHAPGDAGPTGASNPGQFMGGSCAILCGAWTDNAGDVIVSGALSIGAGTTLIVPAGAAQLQLGVDGIGGNFAANSGSFTVNYQIVTSPVTTKVSTLGAITAYYWGDSPHSGPVAAYIWKNAGDSGGSGPVRDISNASGSTTNNSFLFDTTPGTGTTAMTWDVLDESGAVVGQNVVFSPALESNGYQDFNMCIVGNLFVPGPGTYNFTITSKDNVMWGIGGNATWAGKGTIFGALGQNQTVVSSCALLPSPTINGGGPATTISVSVSFPGAGVYPIELDYDYWFHSGRTLTLECNGDVIPPISGSVKTDVSYVYVYRSSLTGATSNPSPQSPLQSIPAIANTITPDFSPDPQVDKVDYYRMDSGLDNYTYVGTGPNTNPPTPFTDTLLDADVIGNPILQVDNYEPFPSIDLPVEGVVDVIGGVVNWVSGDEFNVRWLPGTVINIGGIAYTLYNRPSSTTKLIAVDVADGLGLDYEIAEPILAAQPMASMWGTSDNTLYAFACGDPLRAGTLYWCKGNNLDSAPDTNQQDVTSPSEPLINGVIVNGIGMVFSAENGWMIYPNFYSALATVNGVSGSAFSLMRAGVTRGLYIRPCICTDGSGTFFYRSKDGIEASVGGSRQQSLTDDDLFNLFPHEGYIPAPITLGGYTIYPPDDSQPEKQKLNFATGYLYYDYVDTTGTPRTLVYDTQGKGWVVDVYQFSATLHTLEEGPAANDVLVGCSDGTIRPLRNGQAETGNAVVLTGAIDGGDSRANKRIGDLYFRASVVGSPVTIQPYQNQYEDAVSGFAPASLAVGGSLRPYIVDFAGGNGLDANDIEVALSWPIGNTTYLDLWQPDWTYFPEDTQNRPTDWTDMGTTGNNFVQGLVLQADTFGQPKSIAIQTDDGQFHVPDQNPVVFNGEGKQTLTFTPPFTGYMVRIVSTDNVPWRLWPTPDASWIKQPYPPSVTEWQTQMSSLGNQGWQHIREMNVAYASTTPVTLTLQFDPGAVPNSITLTLPATGGLQSKIKFTIPVNKFKLVSFRLTSSAPFSVWEEDMECKIGMWGRQTPYNNIKPIGAESGVGATV
jgi:hypothetical protein